MIEDYKQLPENNEAEVYHNGVRVYLSKADGLWKDQYGNVV